MRARKNMKEINNSNLIDNDEIKEINNSNSIDNDEIKEIKEIKEINNNNEEEDNNNTFNNEINELGIINSENNEEGLNKKETKNNSINLDGEDINTDNINKKDELKQFDLELNEENKIKTSPIKNNINKKEVNNNIREQNKKINNNKNAIKNELDNNNIVENSDTIIVTINKSHDNEDMKTKLEKEDIKKTNNKNDKKENWKKESPKAQLTKDNKEKKNNERGKEKEEEDIYESDYIIDINSIDELTYYLIKRSEIFDEDFNYLTMQIYERRYIPNPEPQTIFDFMADIIILTKMEKEVIILSLIYIERLIFNTGLLINSRNWRRILLTSMIIASKIWDDNSFENTHFSQVFANLGVGEINTLERIFLELINYKVFVKQSEYFKYLLLLKINALKYNYNGREIIPVSIKKNMKYQEFTETMQNRMRKKVTLNNSAQF